MILTVEPGLLFISSLDGFSRLTKKNYKFSGGDNAEDHPGFFKEIPPSAFPWLHLCLCAVFFISQIIFIGSHLPRPHEVHSRSPEKYPGQGQNGVRHDHYNNDRLNNLRPVQ